MKSILDESSAIGLRLCGVDRDSRGIKWRTLSLRNLLLLLDLPFALSLRPSLERAVVFLFIGFGRLVSMSSCTNAGHVEVEVYPLIPTRSRSGIDR